MSLVTYAADGRVGLVTLNRPDKLNAISPELKTTLVERFHEADRDPITSVVVLRAEGRSFCAGYDISPNPARAARRGNALAWHASLTDDATLELTPWNMKKPVIASVQGHCLGGGCELAMVCDLTIAADDALFGEPEIRFSSVGPVMVMPWVIGLKRARELLYLGDQDVAGAEPADGTVADLDVDGAGEREDGVAPRRVMPGVGALGLEAADDDAAAGDQLGGLGLVAARLEPGLDVLEVRRAVQARVDADDRHGRLLGAPRIQGRALFVKYAGMTTLA